MMDDRNLDGRRNIDGPGYPPLPGTRDDQSFAVPALIIAVILIIGGYFVVTYNSDTVRTASNNTPAVTHQAPAPIPAAPSPSTAPRQ